MKANYLRSKKFKLVFAFSVLAISGLAVLGNTLASQPSDLWKERGANEPLPQGVVPMPSLAPLVKTLRPGVVNINTVSVVRQRFNRHQNPGFQDPFEEFWKRFGGGQQEESRRQSLGSGFIINPQGYVITNNHVVEGATEIRVKLADSRELEAEIVGRDPKTDVALLKLKGDMKDLPFVYLGNSDALQVGDFVLAVGNPFGLDHSVSQGIVSAKERVINPGSAGQLDDFIQTDAAINPGNSGGPLFNTRGEVIGVNTAIVAQGQGIGFAVPINMVKALLPQLQNKGKIIRGWLGVSIQDVTPELAKVLKLDKPKGALVAGVMRKSPADNAGVKAGDVVVAVNGRSIETFNQLSREIAFLTPGAKVQLGILRDGKSKTLDAKITERPEDEDEAGNEEGNNGEAKSANDKLGMAVQPLNQQRANRLGIDGGLQVAAVKPDGPAAKAGIRPGDVIIELQRQPVRTPQEYSQILSSINPGDVALLRLQRDNRASVYIAVRTR